MLEINYLQGRHSCCDVIFPSLYTLLAHYVTECDGDQYSDGDAHSYADPYDFLIDALIRST